MSLKLKQLTRSKEYIVGWKMLITLKETFKNI